MTDLTEKQNQLLAFIVAYKSTNGGDSPSYREMADGLGVSIGTVQGHIAGLIKAKAIAHKKGSARQYKVLAALALAFVVFQGCQETTVTRLCPCENGITGEGTMIIRGNGNVDYGPCDCGHPK